MVSNSLQDQWPDDDPIQCWIGLYHTSPCTDPDCSIEARRAGWEWLDGTLYDHTVFHNWKNDTTDGEPGFDESCARMNILYPERGWIGSDCNGKNGFVCKKGKSLPHIPYIMDVSVYIISM